MDATLKKGFQEIAKHGAESKYAFEPKELPEEERLLYTVKLLRTEPKFKLSWSYPDYDLIQKTRVSTIGTGNLGLMG